MDVLSEVLTATRVTGGVSGRLTARAPWSLHFDEAGAANFHIVVRGSCWLRRAGEDPVLLREGDVTLLPSAGPYTAASHPGLETVPFARVLAGHDGARSVSIGGAGAETVIVCGVYAFGSDLRHPLLSALPRFVHLPATATRGGPIDAAAQMVAAELDDPAPGGPQLTDHLLNVLLIYILRACWQRYGAADSGWFGALRDPHIGRALTLMHQAPERRWTVEHLANAVGLSRAAFARRFAALAGEPPLAYLTRWRMTTAAILLRADDEPLAVIADRVGYDSEFAFARTFRRIHGQPPGRYRAAARTPRRRAD